MDIGQTNKEHEAGTWPWLDRITGIIMYMWIWSVTLFMVWFVWVVLGGPVPTMLREMDMTLVVKSLGVAVLMLTLLHGIRTVWVDRWEIVSAFYPKNIAKTTKGAIASLYTREWSDRTLRALGILAFLLFMALMQTIIWQPLSFDNKFLAPYLWAFFMTYSTWWFTAYSFGHFRGRRQIPTNEKLG